jgi:hypothetical protein
LGQLKNIIGVSMPLPLFSSFFGSNKDNPTVLKEFLQLLRSMTVADAGAWVTIIGMGVYLRHIYNARKTLSQQNQMLVKKTTLIDSQASELQTQAAISDQQSSTLYLMHREIQARHRERSRTQPQAVRWKATPAEPYPFTPYDPDARPEDIIATAQQAAHDASNYINETEDELYSQRTPSACVSNSTMTSR